jgi:hypothetical protein
MKYGRMLSGSTKGSLRRGKNIGENTDGPAKVNKIDDGYYANEEKTGGPISAGFYKKGGFYEYKHR